MRRLLSVFILAALSACSTMHRPDRVHAQFGSDSRFTRNTGRLRWRKAQEFAGTVTFNGSVVLSAPTTSFSAAPLEGDGSAATPFTVSDCSESEQLVFTGGSWQCETKFSPDGSNAAGLQICLGVDGQNNCQTGVVQDSAVDGSTDPVSSNALFDHDADQNAHFSHAVSLGELNSQISASVADGAHTTNTDAESKCTGANVLEGSGACVANAGGGGVELGDSPGWTAPHTWESSGTVKSSFTVLNQLTVGTGACSSPPYGFSAQVGLGLCSSGAGIIALAAGGSPILEIDGTGVFANAVFLAPSGVGSPGALGLTQQSDTNTGLFWPGSDALGIGGGGVQIAIFSVGGSTFPSQVNAAFFEGDGSKLTNVSALSILTATKGADETVTDSTTRQEDDDLKVNLVGDTSYHYKMTVLAVGDIAAGLNTGFRIGDDGIVYVIKVNAENTPGFVINRDTNTFVGGPIPDTPTEFAIEYAGIVWSPNGGEFGLDWAPAGGTGSVSVLLGSHMTLIEAK